jgi:hypothetical protein
MLGPGAGQNSYSNKILGSSSELPHAHRKRYAVQQKLALLNPVFAGGKSFVSNALCTFILHQQTFLCSFATESG